MLPGSIIDNSFFSECSAADKAGALYVRCRIPFHVAGCNFTNVSAPCGAVVLSDDPFLLELTTIHAWRSSFAVGNSGRAANSIFVGSIEVAICGDPLFHAISCVFKEVGKFVGEVSAYKCWFDKDEINGGIDVSGNAMLTGRVNEPERVCPEGVAPTAPSGVSEGRLRTK
jgi:hypothetical protein